MVVLRPHSADCQVVSHQQVNLLSWKISAQCLNKAFDGLGAAGVKLVEACSGPEGGCSSLTYGKQDTDRGTLDVNTSEPEVERPLLYLCCHAQCHAQHGVFFIRVVSKDQRLI